MINRLLAIDPGPVESAYVIINTETMKPWSYAKLPNRALLECLPEFVADSDHVVIEMIASYGMAVGAEVFETCVWIGKFSERCSSHRSASHEMNYPKLIKRHPIKVHHCHSAKANDANIKQALVDRFAPGEPNHGKGTKAAPGFFYGFQRDIWAAYALAVYAADTAEGRAA